MKTLNLFTALAICSTLLSGCARDLSTNVYTSQSTLSLTLEGTIISARPITVKNTDKLGDNTGGMLAGGVAGGVVGSTIGNGNGAVLATVGGALAGAAIGAVAQDQLGKSAGYEYIVKVDVSKLKSAYYEGNAAMRNAISSATTSGVITVVQGANEVMQKGQNVFVIFSDDRTRVIPAS
jgi:outer membrane lipoprotein SlyB